MILDGKTVVIVGVGDGLGLETAELALQHGANVVLAARSADALEETAMRLDETGRRVTFAATDITDPAQCRVLAELSVERFGGLDAAILVAAYERAFGGLYDSDFETLRTSWDTNVIGTITAIREIAPVMKTRGGGSIVLIGSQSMFLPTVRQIGYAASKGGLLSAMYYLADELGPDRIRVNMVVPSWMWGPGVEGHLRHRAKSEGRSLEAVLEEIVGGFPLRRMTEDGEVAQTVLFFASDLSSAVTGQHLLVNCGELMR
jgi:NAD(P)-dependent dehydrogenase (short-subunit alcohol dehydrogenase family)